MRVEYPFPHTFDPARYSLPYLLAHLDEKTVQAQIVQALRAMGISVWPVDVGGKNVRGRAWGALQRAGVKSPSQVLAKGRGDGAEGFPDLPCVLPGGKAMLIEVKAPRWLGASKAKIGRIVIDRHEGEATPEQLSILLEAHNKGAVVGVVWSVADAIEIAKKGLHAVA